MSRSKDIFIAFQSFYKVSQALAILLRLDSNARRSTTWKNSFPGGFFLDGWYLSDSSVIYLIIFLHYSYRNRSLFPACCTRRYGVGVDGREVCCTLAATRVQWRDGWNCDHSVLYVSRFLHWRECIAGLWCFGCRHAWYWDQSTSDQHQPWGGSFLTQVTLSHC